MISEGSDLPSGVDPAYPYTDAGERSAVPSSEARMYGVFSNEVRFKGVNLAPKGEGGAEGDE